MVEDDEEDDEPSASGGGEDDDNHNRHGDDEKTPLVGGRGGSGSDGRAQVSPVGYGSANGHSVPQDSGSLDYSHAHARHHEQNGDYKNKSYT